MEEESILKKIQYDSIKGRRLKLQEWLYKARINIREFCQLIGVNRSYFYFIRRGVRNPSQKILDKVKKVTKGKVKTHEDLIETSPYIESEE